MKFSQFLDRRMIAVFLLGFSSGLPLALTAGTLQAWMTSRNVDLALIGIFSLVGLPYTLKFLWAPFLDRYIPPFLGRRRGWILLSQVSLVLTISTLAFLDPATNPWGVAAVALCISFFSASQDIVVDAYKTEILTPSEFGFGAATANLGYRIAIVVSGAVALILSDIYEWQTVYLIMAAVMSLGLITSFFAPEPSVVARKPKSLRHAVVDPFLEFFQRKGSVEVIAFVALYKLDVVVTLALMTTFMLNLGFTKTEIGTVTKGVGLVATLAGTFAGGIWMIRLGLKRSLWTFGILQGVSGLSFYILARVGHHYPMMVITILCENFFSGMGNAAYAAFLMGLCNPRFTATQFALLSSLMALSRTIAGAPTGWFAKTYGWEAYYLFALFLAIPSLLLLTRYNKWESIKR
jgi:PAT family beta-lactamase induction signal transducer AmpG